MIRLSACIEMLYADLPFADRIAAASETGFDGFEFWSWTNKDLPAIEDAMSAAKIPCAGLCVGTRDEARNLAFADGCLLKRKNAAVFAEMVEETAERTAGLNVRTLIVTTGQALLDVSRGAQQESAIECLIKAAPVAEKHNVTLVLEPLNLLVDHKGYYLDTSAQAMEILDSVNSDSVRMLYDVYHQQITEGFLIPTIEKCVHRIGHFHVADVPGRFEPGTGEINYANVLRAISQTGYDRYVGCEYRPSAGRSTQASAQAILAYRDALG